MESKMGREPHFETLADVLLGLAKDQLKTGATTPVLEGLSPVTWKHLLPMIGLYDVSETLKLVSSHFYVMFEEGKLNIPQLILDQRSCEFLKGYFQQDDPKRATRNLKRMLTQRTTELILSDESMQRLNEYEEVLLLFLTCFPELQKIKVSFEGQLLFLPMLLLIISIKSLRDVDIKVSSFGSSQMDEDLLLGFGGVRLLRDLHTVSLGFPFRSVETATTLLSNLPNSIESLAVEVPFHPLVLEELSSKTRLIHLEVAFTYKFGQAR
jgi:hypothetical protein